MGAGKGRICILVHRPLVHSESSEPNAACGVVSTLSISVTSRHAKLREPPCSCGFLSEAKNL